MEIPLGVKFSIFVGVSGCIWPILLRVVLIAYDYCMLWKRDPTSTYVDFPITFFMVFDTVCNAPFVSLMF